MALDLNALSKSTTTALALSNIILVMPEKNSGYQPTDAITGSWVGDAILFNYEGEQSASLTSDITDHFIEDNSSINDHISLKPEEITTQGFIGELSDFSPKLFGDAKKYAQEKLLVLEAYTPQLSIAGLLAINEAQLIADTAKTVLSSVNQWKTVSTGLLGENIDTQTKQQVAYQAFYGYWRDRNLFTIQTPWGIYDNMAIKTLKAVQDAETRMITDFTITFKKMRFASTKRTSANFNRFDFQSSDPSKSMSQTGPNVVQNLPKIPGL